MAIKTDKFAGIEGQTDILLESGTNELEVLVFGIGKCVFGVNVAKVREVITPRHATRSPSQPQSVLGMFNLRGGVLPLVDLHHYLNIDAVTDDEKQRRVIVTEFNGARAAFQVEYVEAIHRMNWQAMKPVPESHGKNHFAVTGLTEIGGRLVLMLDFESIFDHIAYQHDLHIESVENELGVDRESKYVLIAEDSSFVLDIMQSVLINSGYGNVRTVGCGREAWDVISNAAQNAEPMPDVIVTDVEMPQIDGLHLTRKIKEDARLGHIPVILFSSLITADTRHKGELVGADEQIAKPDLPDLVRYVDRWAMHAQKQSAA